MFSYETRALKDHQAVTTPIWHMTCPFQRSDVGHLGFLGRDCHEEKR